MDHGSKDCLYFGAGAKQKISWKTQGAAGVKTGLLWEKSGLPFEEIWAF